MAVRLQMKLGVVPAPDRLPDSPDTIEVVEPAVGSVARSKGSLYVLVTSMMPGARVIEATRLVAETIRDAYYYDESAGIRVCLEKAINQANRKLGHVRDRFGLGHDPEAGPLGVALAVFRGGELYVATVGPAEAYLIRGARLSTLPDPHRDRGLPTSDLEPEVWRGEVAVGDSLVLISPSIVVKVGPDGLKDALVTLHPQSAIEHLHNRFVAAEGGGSDGAIALEVAEVPATARQRTLVPVRPAEPLAGAPDRSPIPLADEVAGGMAAMQAGARRARSAAGGRLGRVVGWLQDLLPVRPTAGGRVRTYSSRREMQQRAAVAILAFVVVVGVIGFGAYWLAGGSKPREAISSLTAGERALGAARADVGQVFAPGVDLVADDPSKAKDLLTDAFSQLATAQSAGIPAGTIGPLRAQVVGGLDRLYAVVEVGSQPVFAFPPTAGVDLGGLVIGPDGAPYVLDHGTKSVFRIDTKAAKAVAILRAGQRAAGVTVAEPRLMTVGGPDVLVLDAKNVLWRWRPADRTGKGTLSRVNVRDSAGWGTDIRAIGTYVRNASEGLYNLYVVDPSEQQILAYSPAADGSGYPAAPSGRLAAPRDVSGFDALFIDGDIFVTDGGVLERYVAGKSEGWDAQGPGDDLLRPAPRYTFIASGSDRRQGLIYAYDRANARVVALDKASGEYHEQYRLTGGAAAWGDLRGMVVIPGQADAPAVLLWLDSTRLMSSTLQAGPAAPSASPGATGSPHPSPSSATGP